MVLILSSRTKGAELVNLIESAPAKRLRWRLSERGKVVGAEPTQVKEAVA